MSIPSTQLGPKSPITNSNSNEEAGGNNNGSLLVVHAPAAAPAVPFVNMYPKSPLIIDHDDHGHNRRSTYKKLSGVFKYMECLKNHAASIGGNTLDGCGEFMAGGEEGTLEALKCSACQCHRNFHRKIHTYQEEPPSSDSLECKNNAAGHPLTTTPNEEGGVGKKRYRTKFTQEQKEKMYEFAEKSGWKIQKVDDSAVRSFCQELGIKRKVLKVWIHNNKYHLGKKKINTTTTTTSTTN